ncbi:hypothetical protein NDU88_001028 [Pleurodeles waltl]|uniref:Uncharacterized protein n=1 Tax=Pleurodeles waltl TaxID=8319 RepID=A0AAV7MMK3_PLEWA|nr:hypothetical protein NDU88_001028 [Pleurodeles waltl]
MRSLRRDTSRAQAPVGCASGDCKFLALYINEKQAEGQGTWGTAQHMGETLLNRFSSERQQNACQKQAGPECHCDPVHSRAGAFLTILNVLGAQGCGHDPLQNKQRVTPDPFMPTSRMRANILEEGD